MRTAFILIVGLTMSACATQGQQPTALIRPPADLLVSCDYPEPPGDGSMGGLLIGYVKNTTSLRECAARVEGLRGYYDRMDEKND